jgi:NTP pyrophosphatase (non-canonical NTP hydrolase)
MGKVVDLYAHETYIRRIRELYPEQPERANRFFNESELIHAALGLSGESGEVVDIIKKHVAYGKDLDRCKLVLELGDLFHYMVRIMDLTGVTLDEVRDGNLAKLRARYPNGYNNADAIEQKDKTE